MRIATALVNNVEDCCCRVVTTRSDHVRCAPIFTSLHNSNTGSSIEVVDAVVNFSFTKELDQSIYRVHRKIIEAIEWSDAVFLGAEFFFSHKVYIE